MKRRSGLHKKVSSIFGEVSLPDSSPAPHAPSDNAGPGNHSTAPGVGGLSNNPQHARQTPHLGQAPKAAAKPPAPLTEDQEYAASQRKKLFFVIGLACALAVVLFLNFYKPAVKKAGTASDTSSILAIAVKDAKINWPQPERWSSDIKDPMVFAPPPPPKPPKGSFNLTGILYKPGGGSTALINTEILKEGDEIEGWLVKEIGKDFAIIVKGQEKQDLRMEDR